MKILFITSFFLLNCALCVLSQEYKVMQQADHNELSLDSIKILQKKFSMRQDSVRQLKMKESYPNFFAISINGDTIVRNQLQGKITIINFWFEYCKPCIAEFDAFSNLYLKFKDNPSFLFLSFTCDPADQAKAVAYKFNLPYPVYPINREECMRLNLNSAFPTTIILDQFGMIVLYKEGGSTLAEKATQQVRKYEQIIMDLLYQQN